MADRGLRQRELRESTNESGGALNVDESKSYGDRSVGTTEEGSGSDTGLRQGLLSCFISIGTMSIIIWLILFFFLRSGSCTKVDNLSDLVKGLSWPEGNSKDWQLFAQELGLSANQLRLLTEDMTGASPALYQVAKFWYDLGMEVCWERVVSALEVVGEKERASFLAMKYLE